MSKIIYNSVYFNLSYTIENEPPHETIPFEHYDETCALTFIIKGSGTCLVEGNVYTLSDGDVILLSSDEIRSFKFNDEGCHERLSIYFSDVVLSPFLEYDLPFMKIFRSRVLGFGNKYSIYSYNTERIMSIITEIKKFMVEQVEAVNTARLHIFVVELLFWIYDVGNSHLSHDVSRLNDRTVVEICEYIKKNLDKNLSLTFLRSQLFLSRYQLTKVFYRNMGMSITEYIDRKRLIYVNTLIVNGEKIESASYKAGFNSYSSFYKKFIKYYKVSPQKFFLNNNRARNDSE